MKKFYCFYCQQDVEPRRFLKWRFCSKCGKYISDNGEGFYRVCDNCGANMPVDAAECYKCGKSTGLPSKKSAAENFFNIHNWAYFLQNFIISLLGIALLAGILYFSFYIILAAFFCFFIFYSISMLLYKRK